MRLQTAVALIGAALAATLPSSALAGEATGAEMRALAREAAADPESLARLRQVDSVDGRAVDLRSALANANGAELERRLAVLAAPSGKSASAADPSATAAAILGERRFRGTGPPRPFRRALEWLGDRLGPLARPVRWLAGWIPGGGSALWVLLGLSVVGAAAVVAARLGRHRGGAVFERQRRAEREQGLDPRTLDRFADQAESRGELDLALRLRFRAGLVRLAQVRAIPEPETLTSRQLIGLLHSERFDRLAHTLDEVVYGGRAASAADLDAARSEWPQVLARADRA